MNEHVPVELEISSVQLISIIMSKRTHTFSESNPPLKRFQSQETTFWTRRAENDYKLVGEEPPSAPQCLCIFQYFSS